MRAIVLTIPLVLLWLEGWQDLEHWDNDANADGDADAECFHGSVDFVSL